MTFTGIEPDRIYTLTEIGKIMQLSRQTMMRNAIAGKLPGAFRIGSSWRMPGSAVIALMTAPPVTAEQPADNGPKPLRRKRLDLVRRNTGRGFDT